MDFQPVEGPKFPLSEPWTTLCFAETSLGTLHVTRSYNCTGQAKARPLFVLATASGQLPLHCNRVPLPRNSLSWDEVFDWCRETFRDPADYANAELLVKYVATTCSLQLLFPGEKES